MNRQEFVDAIGEVLGLHPGVEVQIDTITRLADAYADAYAETLARKAAEIAARKALEIAARDEAPRNLAWGPGSGQ